MLLFGGTIIVLMPPYMIMTETTVRIADSRTPEYTLDFIEQQMFYGFDATYRAYLDTNHPFEKESREQELRAYEDALNAITHIRQQVEGERTSRLDASTRAVNATNFLE